MRMNRDRRLSSGVVATIVLVFSNISPSYIGAEETDGLEASADSGHLPKPPIAVDQLAMPQDLKWQPALDFDTDSCYNVPAVGRKGRISEGLDPVDNDSGVYQSHCRSPQDLKNTNVYARTRCNHDACAHVYDYYFEKDSSCACEFDVGHRHDWEHIVIWTNRDSTKLKMVSFSQHGDYRERPFPKNKDELRFFKGTHVKMVYHKDGGLTHDFRLATPDDDEGPDQPENAEHQWQLAPLLSWNGIGDYRRKRLVRADFGDAHMAIKDARFSKNLENAQADHDEDKIPFDYDKDEGHNSPGARENMVTHRDD